MIPMISDSTMPPKNPPIRASTVMAIVFTLIRPFWLVLMAWR
jgi:hypothetical protein